MKGLYCLKYHAIAPNKRNRQNVVNKTTKDKLNSKKVQK